MALDLRMASERLAYSDQKHFQGKVCVNGHDHGGFSWRNLGHRNCVDCTREGARRWKAENPERAKQNTRRRDKAKDRRSLRERWPIAVACSGARSRAKVLGVPYDITPDSLRSAWLAQGGRCYWTGVEMSFDIKSARHPLKPSIDRKVPSLGYVVGNVVWATNFANRARSDCPADEFADIVSAVVSSYRSTTTN